MKKPASSPATPAAGKGKKPVGTKKHPSAHLKPHADSRTLRLHSIIIFLFAFLLYANTLGHSYALDDDVVFLKNRDVQAGFNGIPSILKHSFIYGFTGHNDQSYRPVVLMVFAVEKQLFGNNPHTGHFINVLLFALSCVLLYRLAHLLLSNHSFDRISLAGLTVSIPLLTALLFAAHPIHTEAVSNIKGRDDILHFIFVGFSLYFILKHIDTSQKKYFLFSVLFFFLALLSKEMAVTFLFVIPLTVYLFRNIPMKKLGIGMISFAGAFVIYMLLRKSLLETVTFAEKMKVVNNALAAATTESDRIATAVFILGKYLKLLFIPYPLSWDYSFNEIPIVPFTDVKAITTVFVLFALGVFAVRALFMIWKDQEQKKNTALVVSAYAILFFLSTMSVVSNIFIMIGATLGERFLFTPSMAFCLAVPILMQRFGKNTAMPVLAIVLVAFSYLTHERNKDWKDNYTLFLSGIEATPNSSRAQSALGSSYREQAEQEPDMIKRGNLYGQAIVQYNKAIAILPENTEALYNAGVCYYAIGDQNNALEVYQKALKVSPDYTNAANNAGVIYFERKEYEKAKEYFSLALKYDPNNSDALGNMGAINHNQGNMKEAVDYYKRSLSINPGNQNVKNNLEKAAAALKGQ